MKKLKNKIEEEFIHEQINKYFKSRWTTSSN
jgi:hypothetical protein